MKGKMAESSQQIRRVRFKSPGTTDIVNKLLFRNLDVDFDPLKGQLQGGMRKKPREEPDPKGNPFFSRWFEIIVAYRCKKAKTNRVWRGGAVCAECEEESWDEHRTEFLITGLHYFVLMLSFL